MKTKMKTIMSVCMLAVLLYACTKSDSPAPLDCMGIENGLAISDNCGTCHQSYIYNFVTHTTTSINCQVNTFSSLFLYSRKSSPSITIQKEGNLRIS